MVYCDNKGCEFNDQDQHCTKKDIYYANRLCVSFHRRKRRDKENMRELMQTYQSNCHKSGGKYRADHVNILK